MQDFDDPERCAELVRTDWLHRNLFYWKREYRSFSLHRM